MLRRRRHFVMSRAGEKLNTGYTLNTMINEASIFADGNGGTSMRRDAACAIREFRYDSMTLRRTPA